MDQLFLLKADFADPAAGPARYYCPSCVTVRGLLAYYPRLTAALDVHEVDFPRPRAPVAALLGPDHPGCPVLVLDAGREPPPGTNVATASTGRRFIAGAADIARYFALAHGIGTPHP
jgi:hypothetical protein